MLMFRPRTSNLSWLFAMLCIVYFPTFGMYDLNDAKMNKIHHVDALGEEFLEIPETQPEIKSQTIPRCKKIILNESREIKIKDTLKNLKKQNYGLQKSNFNVKIPSGSKDPWLKSPLMNSLKKAQKMSSLKHCAKMDVKAKNESVELYNFQLLTKGNEKVDTFVDKQQKELVQQTKTEKELESQLIQKEKELCDLETKMKSILIVPELISIKAEMELFKLSKIQNEKLIEKENEISDLKKELLELKSIKKENEILDLELELIETTLTWLEGHFVNE